jgi:hypothetical protein
VKIFVVVFAGTAGWDCPETMMGLSVMLTVTV